MLPQDRIAAVRPFWETLSKEERRQLLTLCTDDLRERAVLLTDRYQKQAGGHPPLSRCWLRAGAGPGSEMLASADSRIAGVQLAAAGMLHVIEECGARSPPCCSYAPAGAGPVCSKHLCTGGSTTGGEEPCWRSQYSQGDGAHGKANNYILITSCLGIRGQGTTL